MFNSIGHFVYERVKIDGDHEAARPDAPVILFGILPGPLPDFAKHAALEFAQKGLVQHGTVPIERPFLPLRDVDLLHFVQLAAQRDIGRDKAKPLLMGQRRIAIILLEQVFRHGRSSHSRDGASFKACSIMRSACAF